MKQQPSCSSNHVIFAWDQQIIFIVETSQCKIKVVIIELYTNMRNILYWQDKNSYFQILYNGSIFFNM